MVRVGIVGLGNMGLFHANLFRENKLNRCQLTAVTDSIPERLAQFNNCKTFTEPRKMIQSGLIDAIIIATPHYSHTHIGIDALNQGLHVLVEKPLSAHKADAEKLLSAHKNKNQIFSIMFNLRTTPQYKKIKNFIDSGSLGNIQRINWIITNIFRSEYYYASGNWRATWAGEGGGVLLNQCPHFLDLWQWFCGMPSKVRGFCYLGKYHNIEVEDEVTAYFEYSNGATGVFITSTGEAPGSNRLEIAGDKASLIYENGKILLNCNQIPASEFNKTSKEMFARPSSTTEEINIEGSGGQHCEMIQNFIDAILDGIPLIIPASEGLKSLELGNAILYSSLKQKTIDIPMDGRDYELLLNDLIKSSRMNKSNHQTVSSNIKDSFVK